MGSDVVAFWKNPVAPPAMSAARVGGGAKAVVAAVDSVVQGKRGVIEEVLAGVLARGHVLIEDVPGVGKTTLAQALARALGLSFSRIQVTSDLLPSDVLGVTVFDQTDGLFHFR